MRVRDWMNNMTKFVMGLYNDSFEKLGKDIFRDEFNNIIVDTHCTIDCGWETAVLRNNESTIIVKEYENRGLAEKGHIKWVNKLKKNPKANLYICRNTIDYFLG